MMIKSSLNPRGGMAGLWQRAVLWSPAESFTLAFKCSSGFLWKGFSGHQDSWLWDGKASWIS